MDEWVDVYRDRIRRAITDPPTDGTPTSEYTPPPQGGPAPSVFYEMVADVRVAGIQNPLRWVRAQNHRRLRTLYDDAVRRYYETHNEPHVVAHEEAGWRVRSRRKPKCNASVPWKQSSA